MDENTQPQVHVRCSDLNAVCEARKMVRLTSYKTNNLPFIGSQRCTGQTKPRTIRGFSSSATQAFRGCPSTLLIEVSIERR